MIYQNLFLYDISCSLTRKLFSNESFTTEIDSDKSILINVKEADAGGFGEENLGEKGCTEFQDQTGGWSKNQDTLLCLKWKRLGGLCEKNYKNKFLAMHSGQGMHVIGTFLCNNREH